VDRGKSDWAEEMEALVRLADWARSAEEQAEATPVVEEVAA
jgi:hypothetical protein